MNFHVVTLFPEIVEQAARGFGVVGQAIKNGDIQLTCVSPREFTTNVHHTIDDRPFGGGDGMIMLAEPLSQALAKIRTQMLPKAKTRVIHLSPRGKTLDDKKARELAQYDELVLISSRYGGADQRFLNSEVDEELSIGDYILTGGELAALVVIDAVGRLQAGVLGNEASSSNETFAGLDGLLEHPQFTRPREWRDLGVPEIYMSGDHAKIARYQQTLSILLTALRRPDLLEQAQSNSKLSEKVLAEALNTLEKMTEGEIRMVGLVGPGDDLARVRAKIADLLRK